MMMVRVCHNCCSYAIHSLRLLLRRRLIRIGPIITNDYYYGRSERDSARNDSDDYVLSRAVAVARRSVVLVCDVIIVCAASTEVPKQLRQSETIMKRIELERTDVTT